MKRWNRNADDRRHDCQHEAEQDRDAKAIDQPRQHVAALVVGAEPVHFQIAALRIAVLGGEVAIDLAQHPGRLGRKRHRRPVIDGLVGEMDRRPDLDRIVLGEIFLCEGIAIIGCGAEVVAEIGVGIGEEDREIALAFDMDEDRLVVGDEFGEQSDEEQDEENPQRPVAALIGFEVSPPPRVQRGQGKIVR
jgi:hypothetical protein